MEKKEFILSYTILEDREVFYLEDLNIFKLLKLFPKDNLLNDLYYFLEVGKGESYRCFSSENNPKITSFHALVDYLLNIFNKYNELFVYELELDATYNDKKIGIVDHEDAISIVFFNGSIPKKNDFVLIGEILKEILISDNNIEKVKLLLSENQRKIIEIDNMGALIDIYNDLENFRQKKQQL